MPPRVLGFVQGYRLTWEQLRDEVPLLYIVHWNQRHFVIVYAIKKHRKFSLFHGSGKPGKPGSTKSTFNNVNNL